MIHINHKKDVKGWIRILEAFLAIMIIMGSLLIIISRQPKNIGVSDDIYEKQRQILEIISKNETLRTEVLFGDSNSLVLNDVVKKLSPVSWNYSLNICALNEICPNLANNGNYISTDVYATEILITSNLTEYAPKKLKLFVWRK